MTKPFNLIKMSDFVSTVIHFHECQNHFCLWLYFGKKGEMIFKKVTPADSAENFPA